VELCQNPESSGNRLPGLPGIKWRYFALLRDIYPPTIHFRSRRFKHSEYLKKLVVSLRDQGKGIDDRTVAVFLNGQKVDGEYDPDRDHVLISAPVGLRKGKNDCWCGRQISPATAVKKISISI